MTPYTAYPNIQGIIYQDEMNRNRLMRTDELHKFSDGTLNHVRTALNDIATGIQMEFNTTTGNPVKEILLKLNLPDRRSILTDSKEQIKMEMERRSVKVKELRERCIIIAFKLSNQESAQDHILTYKLKSKECAPAKKSRSLQHIHKMK
ncbi:hypothetical protein Tco_0454134 [Tanacetum coccineum]